MVEGWGYFFVSTVLQRAMYFEHDLNDYNSFGTSSDLALKPHFSQGLQNGLVLLREHRNH